MKWLAWMNVWARTREAHEAKIRKRAFAHVYAYPDITANEVARHVGGPYIDVTVALVEMVGEGLLKTREGEFNESKTLVTLYSVSKEDAVLITALKG